MSEQEHRFVFILNLFRYCRSCAKQYGLPVGEGNRLPTPEKCELCGQVAVRYFMDKTLAAMLLGVDVDEIKAERALNS